MWVELQNADNVAGNDGDLSLSKIKVQPFFANNKKFKDEEIVHTIESPEKAIEKGQEELDYDKIPNPQSLFVRKFSSAKL